MDVRMKHECYDCSHYQSDACFLYRDGWPRLGSDCAAYLRVRGER